MKKNKLSVPIYKGVYYKSCYYNLLLCILLYYKKDISYFFDNDLFYYSEKTSNRNNGLLFSYLNLMNYDEDYIINLEGLRPEKIDFDDIKTAIDNGFPVFMRISRKYWDSKKNISILRNLDLAHNYIIEGYDSIAKKFNVLDSTPDGILETQISYETAIKGIHDYAKLRKRPALQLYKSKEMSSKIELINFIQFYARNNLKVMNGLKSILNAKSSYEGFNSEQWNKMSFPHVLIDISRIISFKKFENFRNSKYIKNIKYYTLYSKKVIETLYVLQGLFTKIHIRHEANQLQKSSIYNCLDKLYKFEVKYFEIINTDFINSK